MAALFTPPVKRIETRHFGKPSHHYEDGAGNRIPGVTTVIKGFMPTPALIRWAANTTAEWAVNNWPTLEEMAPTDRLKKLKGAAWEERDAAALRGTQIHALAEKIGHGEEVEVSDAHMPLVEAAVAFLDEWQAEVLLSEVCVYNLAHGWAGTLDLVARLKDGQVWLLDWKTGKGVYTEAALQMAAYRRAEAWIPLAGGEPGELPPIDAVGVVHLRPEGYSLIPVKADDDTYRIFRHGYVVAGFNDAQEKARKKGGGVIGVALEVAP